MILTVSTFGSTFSTIFGCLAFSSSFVSSIVSTFGLSFAFLTTNAFGFAFFSSFLPKSCLIFAAVSGVTAALCDLNVMPSSASAFAISSFGANFNSSANSYTLMLLVFIPFKINLTQA